MKMKFLFLLVGSVVLQSYVSAQVSVRGYIRKDGTYVAPHMRSSPDSYKFNNYSTKGNVNPYTGAVGTKNIDGTYIAPSPSGRSTSRSTTGFASPTFQDERRRKDPELIVKATANAKAAGQDMTYTLVADFLDSSGNIVAPSGSRAVGKVLQKKGPGMWGQPGKVEVLISTIELSSGQSVTVNAKFTKYGGDARVATVLLSPFLVGFLIKGGGGGISEGDVFTVKLN